LFESGVIDVVGDEDVVLVELDDNAVVEFADAGVDLSCSDDAFWRSTWSGASSLVPEAESLLLPA
jgi:hypothetical protein